MMRTIQVTPGVHEEASGPSYSVLRLCEALLEYQIDVTLASLDWGPINDAPNFLMTFPVGKGPKRLGRSPALNEWLADICADGGIDILHNHGMWQFNSLYPSWVAKKQNIPLVCSPRGTLSKWALGNGSRIKKIFWPLLQRPALKQVACFHATSEAEYRDIRRVGFSQPVAIIPNGIRVADQPKRLGRKERILLFLGRIHAVKGLDMLLPAWKAVQEGFPDWRLVIVGDDAAYHGPTGYLKSIKSQARKLGLKRLEFHGNLYGQNKWQAYRDADLFVLPSYSENFGVTVAEALSMGTPAIVSKGAPWEDLRHQKAGWWIDIGVNPLAACLKEALATSPDQLAAMGNRGRRWMEKDFSWTGIAKKMAITYRWLCNRNLPVPDWVRI